MTPRFQVLSVVAFVAAAVWPLANFINANFSQMILGVYGQPHDLIPVTVGTIAIGFAFSFALSLVRSSFAARSLTVCTVAVFVVFNSQALRGGISLALNYVGLTLGGVSLTLVFMGVLAGLCWLLSRWEPFRIAVAIAAIVAFVMAFAPLSVQFGSHALSGASVDHQGSLSLSNGSSAGENVYFFVLDEYAGTQIVDLLGGDEAEFVREMTSRGFVEDTKARSNYVMTYLSLMAILAGDYPVTETSEPYGDRSSFFPAALYRQPPPPALQAFKAAGYNLVRVANWWAGCGDVIFDQCYPEETTVRTYALDTFLQPTLIGVFITREGLLGAGGFADESALDVLGQNLANVMDRSPFFLLVHHLAPHVPYARAADCSLRHYSEADDALPKDVRIKLYLDAVTCVNTQLLAIIDEILKQDPAAIIAVQGDHGTEFEVDWNAPLDQWSAAAIHERASLLSFVRLPKRCEQWLSEGRGQINTTRLLLACVQDVGPVILPERSFLSAYEFHPKFGEVHEIAP